MPSTDTGYIAQTGGEWYALAQAEVERIAADLGVSPPRWTRAEFVTIVARIMAQLVGEIDGAVEGVFDAHDPSQIAGEILRDYARLAAVSVVDATNSSAVLTVGAWAVGSVTLSAGTEAGDGTNTWELVDDVTIAAGSTATVSARCTTAGPVTAAIGTITQRLSSVAGWTSVTNAAAAIPGTAASTDAFIREAIGSGGGSFGSRSAHAIRTAILNVSDVTDCQVYFNNTLADQTRGGRTVPGNGVAVWVHPSTIPDASKLSALKRLYAMLDGTCARSLPSATGADGVLGEIQGADGYPHEEGFWWFQSTTVYVRVILSDATSYEPGYVQGDLNEAITGAIETFWASLTRSANGSVYIRQQDLIAACIAVPGCARVDLRLGTSATPTLTADLEIQPGYYPALTLTVETTS